MRGREASQGAAGAEAGGTGLIVLKILGVVLIVAASFLLAVFGSVYLNVTKLFRSK